MKKYTRRFLIVGTISATVALAGCNNSTSGTGASTIDARADASLDHLLSTDSNAQNLKDKATGMLVMPLITEAGFGFGAAYGRGVLRVNDVSVDYYSATEASFGFQIGAQQYAHVLFFMTDEALEDFRNSPGWAAGADMKYAVNNNADELSANTTTALAPIIAIVYGQAGLIAGATLEGTKYSRIIP